MSHPPPINIIIDNLPIQELCEVKFLGITIASNLVWILQIHEIKSKISKLTGILYKIRYSMNTDCLRHKYLSLVYPHLLYCSALWGGAYKTFLDSLFVCQKKLLRTMFNKQQYDHTSPLFKEFKLLKLHDIIYLQAGLFVHGAFHTFPVDGGFQHNTHYSNHKSK